MQSFYLNPDGQCKETCPEYYFQNETNQECGKCHESCQACIGFNQNECTQCNQMYLNPDFTCQLTCPDTYFKNSSTFTCDKCSPSCRNCESLSTRCTSCLTGILYQTQCVKQCPNGMFQKFQTKNF